MHISWQCACSKELSEKPSVIFAIYLSSLFGHDCNNLSQSKDTQGLCVALLICFCNSEVMAQFKRKWENNVLLRK
ncbi:hypothetical protein EAI_15922 [Harpegnathos saltator]|uniref:Uncharacterized protein n=1 Tax=Harpegnathos saltator TaxID=610380 RepID=E2B560_HARSA|nr:hypothetical protein EAI_15922 [Harpegnathos saltator]